MFYSLSKGYLTSIYNTRIHCYKNNDTILIHKDQQVSGTTDEKLPYILESLIHDNSNIKILVLTGNGYREAALDWAEYATNNLGIKLFYNIQEANKFLNIQGTNEYPI